MVLAFGVTVTWRVVGPCAQLHDCPSGAISVVEVPLQTVLFPVIIVPGLFTTVTLCGAVV